jgi:putative transposase
MLTSLSAMVSPVSFRFRRRASLELEALALRHQVAVLHRQRPGRAWLGRGDRLLWAWLYRAWPRGLKVMVLIKPSTVIQWHRQGFRKYWRWRSRSRRAGRPEVNREIRELIRQMSLANPLWGAPRIHDEMLKLGIEVSQAKVGSWRARQDEQDSATPPSGGNWIAQLIFEVQSEARPGRSSPVRAFHFSEPSDL